MRSGILAIMLALSLRASLSAVERPRFKDTLVPEGWLLVALLGRLAFLARCVWCTGLVIFFHIFVTPMLKQELGGSFDSLVRQLSNAALDFRFIFNATEGF